MSELLTSRSHAVPAASAPPAGRRRTPRRRLPAVVKISAALVGIYFCMLLLAPGSTGTAAMTNMSFALFPALAAVACWSHVRSTGSDQRGFWRLVASAMAVYACGGLVWLSYALRGLPVPVPSWGEAGFLGYVLPLTAALLVLPMARRTGLARAEVLLDCAVIFTAVLFTAWVLVVAPLSGRTDSLSVAETATLYAYPALDVLVISAALTTLMRVRSREIRAWLALLGGFSLIAAADLLYVGLVARDAYDDRAPYNIMWAVAFLLIGAAPHLGSLAPPTGQRLTVLRGLMPYAALAGAVAVGFAARVSPRENAAVFAIALMLFVVAAVRQVVVVVVKTRLAEGLEGQVESATAELRDERTFLAAVVDSLHAGVVACDRDGNVTLFNNATAKFHSDPGLSRTADWAADLRSADGTRMLAPEQIPLMRALAGERVDDEEFMIMPPHAPAVALTASGRALRNPDGQIVGAVVAMHDVTERRRQQHSLERRAAQDELTGLGNRAAFNSEISRRLAGGDPLAVLLIDLDDFKNINDSLGHDAGDQCLIHIARRMVPTLAGRAHAYRLGGDEFVILLDPALLPAEQCAEQVLAAIETSMHVAGTELRITASIGVALRGADCDSPREMLQAADLAMYVVKSAGKSGVSVYQNHMRGQAHHRLAIEADLRTALDNGELHILYQPIVELSSGRMTAAEALLRWTHPVRGPISPVEFIPIAEQCGLIAPLGEWVLRSAATQLLLWDAIGGDTSFRVTINVSTRQLERPGLLDVLDECLAAGVHPSRMVLEVTETALTVDSTAAIKTMHAIRARGVQLAVDDFGTGYSSLSRLRSAPVSRIKIDRAFISEIVHADSHVPIVEATMAMARGLGMGVIAEGVETVQQLAYLRAKGCPEAQGYLLSRPVDADSVLECMTTPPWAAMLPQMAPGLDPSSAFLRLVELAVDPRVDLETLARAVLADLHDTTGLEMTYLTRVRPETDRYKVTFAQSITAGPVQEGLVVPWSESLCKRALEHGPRRSSDVATDFAGLPVADELGLACYVVEPVHAPDGELFGTLCAASTRPRSFTDNVNAALRMYARLIEQKLQGSRSGAPLTAQPAADRLRAQRRHAEQLWEDISNDIFAASSPTQVLEERAQRLAVADRAWSAQRQEVAARSDSDDDDARLRVVIADDQLLLRQLLAAVIDGEDNLRLVGSADSAWSAVGLVAAEQPDILVLDYDLGDAPASDIIGHIRTLSPGTRVLLHSGRSDVHQLGQRMQVDRVIHKGDEAARLPEALRTMMA